MLLINNNHLHGLVTILGGNWNGLLLRAFEGNVADLNEYIVALSVHRVAHNDFFSGGHGSVVSSHHVVLFRGVGLGLEVADQSFGHHSAAIAIFDRDHGQLAVAWGVFGNVYVEGHFNELASSSHFIANCDRLGLRLGEVVHWLWSVIANDDFLGDHIAIVIGEWHNSKLAVLWHIGMKVKASGDLNHLADFSVGIADGDRLGRLRNEGSLDGQWLR